MAKFTDVERQKLAIEIADYIIDTNSSTRKSSDHFNISNATVSTLMNELLPKLDSKKHLQVQTILNKNKPKRIVDDEVKERVISAANLIKEGFTVEEIAKAKQVTIHVINEDLQTRLPKISKELYEEVKAIQKQNSKNNLHLGSEMDVTEQKRDEYGRFKK